MSYVSTLDSSPCRALGDNVTTKGAAIALVGPRTRRRSLKVASDHLGLLRYGLFMQDYGTPVGSRHALRRPQAVDFVVIQNGKCLRGRDLRRLGRTPRARAQPHIRHREAAPRLPRTRRNTDRRTRHRHAALCLATTVLNIGRLIDWRDRWNRT